MVAACATAAIWCALQGTGSLFHHRIPPPIEITRASSLDATTDKRAIPSSGLHAQQIARAIQAQGLEADLIRPQSYRQLLAIVYAYNLCGIPVLGLLPLVDVDPMNFRDASDNHRIYSGTLRGHHAICFVGYSLRKAAFGTDDRFSSVHLRAYAAERLYAHDDQIGPFSKLVVDGHKVSYPAPSGETGTVDSFRCMWLNERETCIGCTRFALGPLMIPLRTIIRISYVEIMDLVSRLNRWTGDLLTLTGEQCRNRKPINWDLYLSTSNKLKQKIRKSKRIPDGSKLELVLKHLPKYIWIAKACDAAGENLFTLVFDATESHLGNYLVLMIGYNSDCCRSLLDIIAHGTPVRLIGEKGDIQAAAILGSLEEKSVMC